MLHLLLDLLHQPHNLVGYLVLFAVLWAPVSIVTSLLTGLVLSGKWHSAANTKIYAAQVQIADETKSATSAI